MNYTTEELKTLAKYPFLEEAKKYVEQLGLTLEEIGTHPVYSAAIELGKQRIIEILENRFKPLMEEKTDLEVLILSYPVARILVSLTGNRTLSARYANAEASFAYSLLRGDENKNIEKIKEDLNLKIKDTIKAEEFLGLAVKLAKENPKWKLVNRTLERGLVKLEEGEALIMMREAIRLKVSEPIKIKTPPESMKKTFNEIKGIFMPAVEEANIEFLDEKATPPCIKYIISLVQNDQANHNARFILATFLVGIGLKEDEILKIFATSPKYDEEKTRYQLEFLTGQKGNTKYTCPACPTIKSYGLCKANCNVKHPQQYYRNNSK